MLRPCELDEDSSRRATLGIACSALASAIGLAPWFHHRTHLNVEIELLDYGPVEADRGTDGTIDELRLELTNASGDPFTPLVSTWDQRRTARHTWQIATGTVPLEDGDSDEYRVVAPTSTARLHADVPAQITVAQRGQQRWNSIQRTL